MADVAAGSPQTLKNYLEKFREIFLIPLHTKLYIKLYMCLTIDIIIHIAPVSRKSYFFKYIFSLQTWKFLELIYFKSKVMRACVLL